MNKLLAYVSFTVMLTSCVSNTPSAQQNIATKLYVAVEGENRIVVLNPATQKIVKTIDLSQRVGDTVHEYAPHNVQVAPDGKSVWVTANHGHKGEHQKGDAHRNEDEHSFRLLPFAYACHPTNDRSIEPCSKEETLDQIIIIDPRTDTIVKRIPIDLGIHLAHVVVTKDGSFAYTTAQKKGAIYKIDARDFRIVEEIEAPKGSEPHGLRLSPDDTTAYIALLQGKGLGILDLRSETLTTVPLAGNAVQTGVTPDGRLVVISLYDTKQLAIFDMSTKNVSYIDLPNGAKGPIQMYSTPDSRFVYIADQGYYFEQPMGNRVFKVDLITKNVVKEITAGDAPHGVAVSPDGKFVYVTNLLTQDVSIIDTMTDTEIGRIEVGKMPNGISVWSRSSGGTP